MKIVICQPMFFPWIGFFEQINLSDTYIHLDDVQMPGGQSFMHRVQLKGPSGPFWWGAPIRRAGLSTKISEVSLSLSPSWISRSMRTLEQIFSGLPYKEDAMGLFEKTLKEKHDFLSEMTIFSTELIANYLGIKTNFKKIERDTTTEDKTEKILEILKKEKASIYISGKGGLKYLIREEFEKLSIQLLFVNYENVPYKQKYGSFDPYVSVLHPIAALGQKTADLLVSQAT